MISCVYKNTVPTFASNRFDKYDLKKLLLVVLNVT